MGSMLYIYARSLYVYIYYTRSYIQERIVNVKGVVKGHTQGQCEDGKCAIKGHT